MNKLEMAHQMACAMMASNDGYTIGGAIECALEYADAMQKEWDERDNKEACGHDWNETTSNGDKYRFFVCKNCDATRNFEPIEEWQPDWSQAPDSACCWFVGGISRNRKAYWSDYIPCYKNDETQTTWSGQGMVEDPMFGYGGKWQDSLRKRP